MNVVITGISKGLGRALMNTFIKDEKISKIYGITSSSLSDEVIDHKVTLIKVNFLEPDFETEILKVIEDTPIHILINNAGYLKYEKFTDFNIQNYQKTFQINFQAPATIIHALLTNLINGKAHVINIGSMGGFQGSSKFPGLATYSASKSALSTLTECLAEEFKEEGVKFNCLALGAVNTEMLRTAFPGFTTDTTPELMAKLIKDFSLNWGLQVNGQVYSMTAGNPG